MNITYIIIIFIILIILSIILCFTFNNNKCGGGLSNQFKTKFLNNQFKTKLSNNQFKTKLSNNTNPVLKKTNIQKKDNYIKYVNKAEGYIDFSKNIYHQISNHAINLSELNIGKIKKMVQKKLMQQKFITKDNKNKHWSTFESWDKLQKDPIAKKEYLDEKNKIIEYPKLDWSDVLTELLPKLKENREYIGIINLNKNTNKLYIKKYEGSPTTADEEDSDTTFASIPSHLVDKYSNMVGLFMFHTHPEDIRGSPLPSSYDLSAALYFSSISRFAASVIVSRYGVLMYGLSISGYNLLTKSKDYNLAVLNLSFDIISAHESIRSWSKWKLDDYIEFYKRYKMFMYVFPSSEYVADNIKYENEWNINNAISYDLILDHYDDINNYLKKT